MPIGCVRVARHYVKMYSRHLFPYGETGTSEGLWDRLGRRVEIDLSHSAAMLSLRRIKSFVFAVQTSHWILVWARLALQKQKLLFSWDSTWPPSEKGLLHRWISSAFPGCQLYRKYPFRWKLFNRSYATPWKCRKKCTCSSAQFPVYPNDPTILYSNQPSYSINCHVTEVSRTLHFPH